MPTLRARWWWLRRCCVAWVRDHWSDGSTIVTVWLRQRRVIVPRRFCSFDMSLRHMLTQTAISLDQTLNVLLSWLSPWAWRGAWADETLSCRAYRAWRDGAVFGRIAMPVIDFLFRWQTLPDGAIGHCHGAYIKERAKYNHPPEMRE